MRETILQYGKEDDPFYISHIRQDGPSSMAYKHFHNSYELYYLISGQRYYFIKDRTFQVMEKDLVLIKRGDLHKTASCGESQHERIVINFREEFLNHGGEERDILLMPFERDINIIRFTLPQQEQIEKLLGNICYEIRKRQPAYKAYVRALLVQFLIYISRHVCKNGKGRPFIHPTLMHRKVSNIVKYINSNYRNDLTLTGTAQKFNMSSSYLSRIFKQGTGFTFIEYLNSVRIREAQSLLLSTDNKVMDICHQVGYTSISHFGRVFKELTGYSPLQFRQRSQSQSLS